MEKQDEGVDSALSGIRRDIRNLRRYVFVAIIIGLASAPTTYFLISEKYDKNWMALAIGIGNLSNSISELSELTEKINEDARHADGRISEIDDRLEHLALQLKKVLTK